MSPLILPMKSGVYLFGMNFATIIVSSKIIRGSILCMVIEVKY